MFKLNTEVYEYLKPYVIAEIGVNHAGDMNIAKKMIKSVADAGGHAAKFQTYKAEKIAAKSASPSYWDTSEEPCTSQFELFKKYDSFGEEEYRELADYCKECGVNFLSTPFDLDAVDELFHLMPCFKIASADITNIPLVRKIASKGKPVIVSTGASKLFEIENALQILEKANCPQITLLHCVLNYPTPQEHAQMYQMKILERTFGGRASIGYSDHVKPNKDGSMPALEMAVLSGSVVIEKHFTYDKTLPGNDHYHAMDEYDLRVFMNKVAEYKKLSGGMSRNIDLEASAIKNARRRVVVARDLEEGYRVTELDLIALRADRGIESIHWDEVVGKMIVKSVKKDTPLDWSYLK